MRGTRVSAFALFLATLCACATAPGPGGNPRGVDQEAVELSLQQVCLNYQIRVATGADTIAARVPHADSRRWAIHWQILTHTNCRRALNQESPLGGLLGLWTMAERRRRFLSVGEGRAFFAEAQDVAVEVEAGMASFIAQTCAALLPPEAYEAVSEEVERFVAANPTAESARTWASTEHSSGGSSVLQAVHKIAPSLGIKQTASSIADVARAVDEVGTTVSDLPLVARWQMELILLDLNENVTVQALQQSVRRITESAQELVQVADRLPATLQGRVSTTLDEIDRKQEGLRETLRDAEAVAEQARRTVDGVNSALKEVDAAAASTERLTKSLARAGEAWYPTVGEVRGLIRDLELSAESQSTEPVPAATDDSSGPDDLQVIAKTAESLTVTATELHGMVTELRTMLDGDATGKIGASARATVDHSASRIDGLIAGLVWRLLFLAAGLAVIVLAYRLVAARLVRT